MYSMITELNSHLNGRGDPARLFGADNHDDAEDVGGGLHRGRHEVCPHQQDPELFLMRLHKIIDIQLIYNILDIMDWLYSAL